MRVVGEDDLAQAGPPDRRPAAGDGPTPGSRLTMASAIRSQILASLSARELSRFCPGGWSARKSPGRLARTMCEDCPMIGVILLQFGTPEAPTPAAPAVFAPVLSDRRVVDLPRALWWPILNCIVLPPGRRSRPALPQGVDPEGSPLAWSPPAQAGPWRAPHGRSRPARARRVGMRYGEPSIATRPSAADRAPASTGSWRFRCTRSTPAPRPDRACSSCSKTPRTCASCRRSASCRRTSTIPDISSALAAVAREALAAHGGRRRSCWQLSRPAEALRGRGRSVPGAVRGDGARARGALRTAAARIASSTVAIRPRGMAAALHGQDARELGRAGARVAVLCPGFTADCLETLEEIGIRGAEQFGRRRAATEYLAIPCLNEHPRLARRDGRDCPARARRIDLNPGVRTPGPARMAPQGSATGPGIRK